MYLDLDQMKRLFQGKLPIQETEFYEINVGSISLNLAKVSKRGHYFRILSQTIHLDEAGNEYSIFMIELSLLDFNQRWVW